MKNVRKMKETDENTQNPSNFASEVLRFLTLAEKRALLRHGPMVLDPVLDRRKFSFEIDNEALEGLSLKDEDLIIDGPDNVSEEDLHSMGYHAS